MRPLLLAVPLFAVAGCSNGLFSPDDGDFEFTGYELVFRVDADETVAGQPVPYTAWLVDADDEPATGVEWNLASDIEPELHWGDNALTPIVAGDHVLTMTTVHGGITYTDDADLTVFSDSAYDLDLVLSDAAMAAGDDIAFTVSLVDVWGNELDASGAVVEVDSPDVDIVGAALSSTIPGTYLASAALGGLYDVEPFVVVPGPPADVTLSLSTTDLELFQTTSSTVVVTDDWGNVTDDPWTITTDRPSASVVSHRNVTFLLEGWHTVTVTVDGTSLDDSVGPFLIDSTGPDLVITTPPRGAWRTTDTGTVSGTVFDEWSTGVDLTVNGTDVAVGGGGAFSTTVDWDWGVTLVETEASDTDGNVSTDTRAVLADQFRGYGYGVSDGVVVRMNEGAGGIGTLEAIGEGLISSYDLDDLIPWPVYSNSSESCFDPCFWPFDPCPVCFTWYSVDFYVYNPYIGSTDLWINPWSTGQVQVVMTVSDVRLDWWASAVVAEIGFSGGGDISASSIGVELMTRPRVTNGQIYIDIESVNAWMNGFYFDWDSWLKDVLDFFGVWGWINSAIQSYMVGAIEDAVYDEVPPVIEDALQDLELLYSFDVADRTYTLEAEPQSISVDWYGITLGMQTWVTVDSWTHPGWWGYGSLYADFAPPYWASTPRMNAAFSGDLLNQVLYATWGGGLLDIEQDSAALGLDASDLELILPGLTSLTVKTHPLLPPVVVPGSGTTEYELQVGDLRVTLYDGPVANNQVMIDAYVTAYADLNVWNVGDSRLAADIGAVDVYFDVLVPDANTEGAADTEALLEALVPLLLPQLTDAIGEIDIPSISGFGISGIAVGTGGGSNGYMTLGGNLYEQ